MEEKEGAGEQQGYYRIIGGEEEEGWNGKEEEDENEGETEMRNRERKGMRERVVDFPFPGGMHVRSSPACEWGSGCPLHSPATTITCPVLLSKTSRMVLVVKYVA